MKKNSKIIFRLSDNEKGAAERIARSGNTTVSEFLRTMIKQAASQEQKQRKPEMQAN